MPEHSEHGIIPSYRPEEYVFIKQRLPMDLMRIDDEVIELPVLIQQAGEYASEAIEIRETAKEQYEKAKAEAGEILRNTPTPKGKDRSETMIASQIPLSPVLSQRSDSYSQARLDASLWNTLVDALRSKNSAIKVIVDLINSGYLTTTAIHDKRRRELRNNPQVVT